MKIRNRGNALLIGDTHIPFTKKGYLEFCKKTYKEYNCKIAFHVGDIVDHHAISFHDSDPDGMSAGKEYLETKKMLQKWYKAFPELYVVGGNHCSLPKRRAFAHGLPSHFMKSFLEIYDAPKAWRYEESYDYNGFHIFHGTGYSGQSGHIMAANKLHTSVAIGHLHSVSGIQHLVTPFNSITAMAVGCGIDDKAYAFQYGKNFPKKSVISVGLILNNGKDALVKLMPLGKK